MRRKLSSLSPKFIELDVNVEQAFDDDVCSMFGEEDCGQCIEDHDGKKLIDNYVGVDIQVDEETKHFAFRLSDGKNLSAGQVYGMDDAMLQANGVFGVNSGKQTENNDSKTNGGFPSCRSELSGRPS